MEEGKGSLQIKKFPSKMETSEEGENEVTLVSVIEVLKSDSTAGVSYYAYQYR
jgi:hypothetical protein